MLSWQEQWTSSWYNGWRGLDCSIMVCIHEGIKPRMNLIGGSAGSAGTGKKMYYVLKLKKELIDTGGK